MILHITKKLAEKINGEYTAAEPSFDELYSWRANLVQKGRRNIVVFMNDASRYTIVLIGIKAKDWAKLPELFIQTLKETLLAEQVNPEVIDRYLSECGKITYARNADRQKTAQLNKACEDTGYALDYHDDNVGLSLLISDLLVNTSNEKEWFHPNRKILELLNRYGLPVKKCCAFDIKVRLALEGHYATRNLRIPANITFERLHKILQSAFGWRNQHLYCFALFEKGKNGESPAIELVTTEDELEYKENAKLLSGVKLSDYLPRYKHLLYVYDYGDDWQHYIEVTSVLEDCTEDLPILLSGEGDAPPEDVGGVYGYEEFLEAISDPDHEDHEDMTEWARMQSWERFSFENTKRRLKHMLSR